MKNGDEDAMASTKSGAPGTEFGWFGTETVKTRLGAFEFTNSYPTATAAQQLRDALFFNRAVEAYLVQMHGVSWYSVWKGVAQAGRRCGEPDRAVGDPDGRRDAAPHR